MCSAGGFDRDPPCISFRNVKSALREWFLLGCFCTSFKSLQNRRSADGLLGFPLHFLCISLCNLPQILNISFVFCFGFFKIRKLIKKYNFEVFQASDAGGAILALIVSKLYRKKFIFEVQGDIFDYPGKVGGRIHSSLVKFFSRILVKRADYIRIVSPFLFEPLDKLNINREKIFLVPPRCDSKLFSKQNVKADKPMIFNENQCNLLFVGNLLKAKGVDILLEAFALIEKENSNIGLVFVGDGDEKERLITRSKEFGIREKVTFLGRVEYDTIPTLMYYADILILPSIEEGVGRVLLEAMSMHLPIIASNVGGIPLVVDDKKDGLLFEVGEIGALKEKVLFLLNDPTFSKDMAKVAHQKFLENYEYEISMKKFIDMYQSILET